ncbi:hypothetical protein BGX26_002958 [Mortierella sp. AD094]|nr:hypothetical protein BGX26_002958 [Mortierella sp. AD094]
MEYLMRHFLLSECLDGIRASFVFKPTSGAGAQVTIDVQKGLSKSFAVSPTGGFEYHIHVKPVGANNDCMATGGHLDPANVGAAKCNPAKADKCQEGDLSGKHGELKATESGQILTFSYVDHQLQFSGDATTIAGRSVVIHNNGTRVACGDILPVGVSRNSSISSVNATSTGDQDKINGTDAKAPLQTSNSRIVGWNTAMMVAGTVATGILGTVLTF